MSELAAERIPVTVTCRGLKLAGRPYYRWLAAPVSDALLAEAYLANSVFDAHRDDPEFGDRFLINEVRDADFEGLRAHGVVDLFGDGLVVSVRQTQEPQRIEGGRYRA